MSPFPNNFKLSPSCLTEAILHEKNQVKSWGYQMPLPNYGKKKKKKKKDIVIPYYHCEADLPANKTDYLL